MWLCRRVLTCAGVCRRMQVVKARKYTKNGAALIVTASPYGKIPKHVAQLLLRVC